MLSQNCVGILTIRFERNFRNTHAVLKLRQNLKIVSLAMISGAVLGQHRRHRRHRLRNRRRHCRRHRRSHRGHHRHRRRHRCRRQRRHRRPRRSIW